MILCFPSASCVVSTVIPSGIFHHDLLAGREESALALQYSREILAIRFDEKQ